jgi:hypothetical protein
MLMLRRFAPLILGTFLIACGDDSTGPNAVDLRLVARSFDDLGLSRQRAGDGDGAAASQAAAIALRTGIRPARVRIAVDGVTEDYWALEIERGFAGISMLSSVPGFLLGRTLVAWRGGPAERVISIVVAGDTGTFSLMRYYSLDALPPDRILLDPAFGVMFDRGGPANVSIDGGARSTRESLGAECQTPERESILEMLSSFYLPATCQRARFFTRFNMRVQEWPIGGLNAARTRVVEMAGHDIPGVRFEYQPIDRPCPVCR